MKKIGAILLYILIFTFSFSKLVEYEIDIAYTEVNFTGTPVEAMTLNGGIPGPTLEFTEGDVLRVTFNNYMDVETSIHWHGLLVPNDQDGVPYLNTPPILPGTSFTYEIPLIQSGTYWYHSHTGLQEQRGVYGSIVIHPKDKKEAMTEYVVVLSDWTDESPEKILINLKKDGDYYALKKGRVQSWQKVIKNREVKERLMGSLMRMGPMDLSDVGYDAFFINGQKNISLQNISEGTPVKLRVINAAASTYFNLSYSKGDMKIVAADGLDVVPVNKSKLLIGVAETYDLVVEAGGSFTASAQDGTGYALLHIGKMNMMPMEVMKMEESDMQSMNSMNSMEATHYDFLRSKKSTEYNAGLNERVIQLNLTGDMDRYVWTFNNKALTESDKILVRKGEKVKFILKNETMMHHPLHLHGHFFRVINKQGANSPLKHTVDIPPMQTVEIEFLAQEEKDWFFHCHNLYHMKTGMSRIVSYDSKKLSKDLSSKLSWDRRWFYKGHISGSTNYSDIHLTAFNSKNTLSLMGEASYGGEHDMDIQYGRYINKNISLITGFNFEEGEDGEIDNRGFVGVEYLLPLLIESEVKIYDDGDLEAEFSSELQLTDKFEFNWELDTDGEHLLELEYRYKKWLSFIANVHSEYDEGVGIRINF
ncbi:multicopper oxidase domain-containing protein [uncultured Ilyobacter sp.]|uniref:multicopper oxidase family protein n=1 Tax=uncultured Ilyobacter sp. TaxID=544433 RepID=UPI0029C96456|nr:multicopper oxidase domain-containing protein [uncultured Ilyobacter sp.]